MNRITDPTLTRIVTPTLQAMLEGDRRDAKVMMQMMQAGLRRRAGRRLTPRDRVDVITACFNSGVLFADLLHQHTIEPYRFASRAEQRRAEWFAANKGR